MIRNNHFGVTSLDENQLSTLIPTTTFGGGTVVNPAKTLIIWRTTSTERAKGAVLGFFVDDARLAPLLEHTEKYAIQFARAGVGAIIEPDFSMWSDMSEAEQLLSVRQKKIVSRIFQSAGLKIIPNLNWSNEESFPFAFAGVPVGAPVVACECRTAGSCDADRRAFLAGLTQAVRVVQPKNLVVYGGSAHKFWLDGNLPQGPVYHLVDSWTDSRGRIRKTEKRQLREKNQLKLFGGGSPWVEEAVQAA
jgi:hypothetical protein